MATVNNILTQINGQWIYLMKYGYMEVPSSMLMFYNLADLNKPNFDFKSAKPKNVVREVSMFSNEKHKVKWNEENIREQSLSATTAAGAGTTSFDVDVAYLQEWDALFNPRTGETMHVVAVSWNTVTVDENNNWVNSWDTLVRSTYAKTYLVSDASRYQRNDVDELWNYVQYNMVELNSDEVDMATMNLTRLFYNSPAEYLKEGVFARASRKFVYDMMMTLYTWKRDVEVASTWWDKFFTWWLDYFLRTEYPVWYNVNFRWATDKESIQNLRDEVTKAYASWVPWLYANNRLVMFVNTAMAAQIDDLFMDKITYLENDLNHFSINMKEINMNGRKITIVEDVMLNYLYPNQKVWYIVDLQWIGLFQVANDVIDSSWRTVPRMPWVAKIFAKPQDTPEGRQVYIFGHRWWIFKNIKAGVFRKVIYA